MQFATRLLKQTLKLVALLAIFLSAFVAALVFQLDSESGRVRITQTVNSLLRPLTRGKIEIASIDGIGIRTLRASKILLQDAEGREIVVLNGVRVEVAWLPLLFDVVRRAPVEHITLNHIRAEHLEVWLEARAGGELTLAEALSSPSARGAADGSKPSASRPWRVHLPVFELGRAVFKGPLLGTEAGTVRLYRMRGAIQISDREKCVDLERFSVMASGFPPETVKAIGSLHFRQQEPPSSDRLAPSKVALWGTLDGFVGQLQVNGSFRLRDQHLEATIDAPRATPAAVRGLYRSWPLNEPVTVHAEARGSLPELSVKLEATARSSKVVAEGALLLSPRIEASLEVGLDGLDLSLFSADAPRSSLASRLSITLRDQGGTINAKASGRVFPTLLAEQAIPEVQFEALLDKEGVRLQGSVLEPGVDVRTDLFIRENGQVEVSLAAGPALLEGIPRLNRFLPAKGLASVTARGHIRDGTLSLRVVGGVEAFDYAGVTSEHSTVTGYLQGPLAKTEVMKLHLEVNGQGLRAPNLRFDQYRATLSGTPADAQLRTLLSDPHGPIIEAKTTLSLQDPGKLSDLELSVRREGSGFQGTVKSIAVLDGTVALRSLKLAGDAGQLEADLELGKTELLLRANGSSIDLSKLARILGLPTSLLSGRLEVDANVESRFGYQQGTLRLALGRATLGPFRDIALRASGELTGEDLRVSLSSLVPRGLALGLTAEAKLAGAIFKQASFANATGTAELHVDRANLEWLDLIFDRKAPALKGHASARVTLNRTAKGELPSIVLLLETLGLHAAIPHEGAEPLGVSDLDLSVASTFSGKSGEINLTAALRDKAGPLASGVLSTSLDPYRLRADPLATLTSFLHTPLQAEIALEERDLDKLPPIVDFSNQTGRARARLGIAGTLAAPSYDARLEVTGLNNKTTRLGQPLDVKSSVVYQTSSQTLLADASFSALGRTVGHLRIDGKLPPGGLTLQQADAIEVDARMALAGLPLTLFPPLADANIIGELTGELQLSLREGMPRLLAAVDVSRASIDRIPVAQGRLEVSAGDDRVFSRLRLSDSGGNLEATITLPVELKGALPVLPPGKPLAVTASASRFNAGILLPLLGDVLSELRGSIDAKLEASLLPIDGEITGGICGSARLERGQLQLQAMGMRLDDVSFAADLRCGSRETEIFIKSLTAKARSQVNNLHVRNLSLYMNDLELGRGQAELEMTQPVPLLIEGVSQGTMTGRAQLRMQRAEEAFLVTIFVPELEARLPKATARRVVDVSENPDILVRQPLSEEHLKKTRSQGVPWILGFQLGENVSVTRSDFTLGIRGSPELRLGEQTQIDGQVELIPGGRAQLLGKVFIIEQGSVRFDTGDSKNPRIDVTASWRASDSTTVYVDIRGTFQKATLNLRSDPPLGSETELQALLLGGGSAQGEGSAESAGIGIGAGLLGDLLADTPIGGLELRTASEDTEVAGTYSTYTAAYPLSEKVWFEGSYKRAEDPVSQEQGDAFSGTVDWRFRPNWSLRTEVGRLGTRTDLLWRYRY